MEYRHLVRDPEKVKKVLWYADDGSISTSKTVKIYVPERYTERQLATVASDTYIVGYFAMVLEDKYYTVSKILAPMRIKPTVISTVKFDGADYLEFQFDAGSVVIADSQLVRDDILTYRIFNEFVSKGHVPWFIDYRLDLGGLFDSSAKFAGVNFGANRVVLEIIAAAITRVKSQPTKYYRHAIQNTEDLTRIEPVNIPLRSVSYGATNTTSKLVGSYFGDGLTAALVNPADKVERIETILRM